MRRIWRQTPAMNITQAQTLVPDVSQIVSINPATMEELGRAPIFTREQVQQALDRARAVQPSWGSLSFKQRGAYILKAKDLLVQRQDELCDLIARETGKPALEALSSEVMPVANLMDYFARKSEKLLRDEQFTLSVFRNKKSRIGFYPVGVAGIISPWNYPFSIPMGEAVMGLRSEERRVGKESRCACAL